MANKKISQLVERLTTASTDVFPVVYVGATETQKVKASTIFDYIKNQLVFGIIPATLDTDKFLVLDGTEIKYRTGSETLNDILPTQTGNAGKVLQTDGINASWQTASGGSNVALPFSTDHLTATGNQYLVGDVVYYAGNIYRCIANNDSILPTNASYWVSLGAGYPLVERPIDWNATTGNNQILNKPTIPASPIGGSLTAGFIPYATGVNTLSNSALYYQIAPTYEDLRTTLQGIGDTGLLIYANSTTQQYNYKLGDYNNNVNGTVIVVNDDTTNQNIYTANQSFVGGGFGLKINFNNKITTLGDFQNLNAGTKIIIDDINQLIQTEFAGDIKGIVLDFTNDKYILGRNNFVSVLVENGLDRIQIGDWNYYSNGTNLWIDDLAQKIEVYNTGNIGGLSLDFLNKNYYFGELTYGNQTHIFIEDTTRSINHLSKFNKFKFGDENGQLILSDENNATLNKAYIQNPFNSPWLTSNVYYNNPNYYYGQNGYGAMIMVESTTGTINFITSPLNTAGNNVIHTPAGKVQITNDGTLNVNKFVTSSYKLDVASTINGARITGSGTTSATTGLRVETSGATSNFIVLDNGNCGIRQASPTARLHIATGGSTTASLGLKVRNSADTFDILSTFGTTQVIINSNSASLQTSAQLQIDSSDRGVLVPRMTTAQILAIVTPANGLLVYNTTINHMCCYQGGAWVKFSHSPM